MLLSVLLNLQSRGLFWEDSNGTWLLMPLPRETFFTGRTFGSFSRIIWKDLVESFGNIKHWCALRYYSVTSCAQLINWLLTNAVFN